MLKTAMLTLGLCVSGTNAFAAETPSYDRKIERAAILQVAKKMGALRETLADETRIAEPEMAMNVDIDLGQTMSIAAQPNEPRFPLHDKPKNFRIIAGEYGR